jgi:hypothetical protein
MKYKVILILLTFVILIVSYAKQISSDLKESFVININ